MGALASVGLVGPQPARQGARGGAGVLRHTGRPAAGKTGRARMEEPARLAVQHTVRMRMAVLPALRVVPLRGLLPLLPLGDWFAPVHLQKLLHSCLTVLQALAWVSELHGEDSVGQLPAHQLTVEGLSLDPLLQPCQIPKHQELLQAEEECCARQLQAVAHQSMVRDLELELELELAGVAEQQSGALEGAAHPERSERRLHPEAVARRQWARQLEPGLQRSHECCEEREQAVRRRDERLHQAWAEGARAHGALLQREQELERSRAEWGTLRGEGQALRHQAAQATAQLEEEQVLLPQSRLRAVEEQLAELMRHMQAGCQLEAEREPLRDRLFRAEVELEQKRAMLQWQAEELSRAKRQLQRALQAAQQHQRAATRLELDLASRQEGLSCLQQQLCTAQRQLGSQAQCWQREQEAARLALAEKDEELVVMKVELASLEERCCRVMEEKEELQKEASLLRQKAVLARQELSTWPRDTTKCFLQEGAHPGSSVAATIAPHNPVLRL
ncbi:rootletin-like [Varanus komodoensis]|uniref:rootletin-like n=1 Tax=Varanus komodoensis TaxID=61221 RepID=UPI001CF7E008|nr:rootletin-like [Varanus komodoensis]